MPVMLTPFTTALISSRKSVRKRKGSGDSFATRAISPVIRIWHAIMRPFSSSIMHSGFATCWARYGRHPIAFQPFRIGLLKLDEVRLPSRGDRLALLGGDRIRSLAETL